MTKIPVDEAFKILFENDNCKKEILRDVGEEGVSEIKQYFKDEVDALVDVNANNIKDKYFEAVLNGPIPECYKK